MKIRLELAYLPPIPYVALLMAHPQVELEKQEHYQKRTYRNRCHIVGANGLLRLSIPLKKGKNSKQIISDVRIAYNEPWQAQHWQSIRSAYGNAPFFEHYAPFLEPLFQREFAFLFDFNLALLKQILMILQIETSISFSTEYEKNTDNVTLDARNCITPQNVTMPQPFNYQEIFYPQVFQEKMGFIPNLSVLDLLFCTGPQAFLILEQSIQK